MSTESRLFSSIASANALRLAWEKVKRNNGCAGGDGQSIATFERQTPAVFELIAARIRNGTYRPRPIRTFHVKKKDGGARVLAIPSVSDRIVQTAAAQLLGPVLEPQFSTSSFGYRPGRSVGMAVDRISALRAMGYAWVVEADIVRAFDNVPHQALLDQLEQMLPNTEDSQRLSGLIGHWLEHIATALESPDRGLAQGSPLSPLLFNLFLDRLDDAFDSGPVRIVRFADDFLLLATTREAAIDAQERASDILAPLGLRFDDANTGVVSFEQGFRFLGHVFVRAMALPSPAEDDAQEDIDTRAIMADIARDDAERENASKAGLDPGARVLYLQEPGRRLTLSNQSFSVIGSGDTELLRLSHGRIDRIDIGPGVGIDPDVLRHALSTGTALDFSDGHGQTLGSLMPPTGGLSALHLAQARVSLDPGLRFALARQIVDARMTNQIARLRVLNRKRKDADVIAAIAEMGRARRKTTAKATDIQGLLGHEGAASKVYWRALARLCDAHKGRFTRQRPARTPLNAAINYLTALLERDVRSAVHRAGLHPGFGVLHSTSDRNEACIWDLMEGFRAMLTEGLAVSLFNRGRLKLEMFDPSENSTRIGSEGRRALILGYEAAMERAAKSGHTNNRHSQRRRILEEARALARHVRAPETTTFTPDIQDF